MLLFPELDEEDDDRDETPLLVLTSLEDCLRREDDEDEVELFLALDEEDVVRGPLSFPGGEEAIEVEGTLLFFPRFFFFFFLPDSSSPSPSVSPGIRDGTQSKSFFR